MNVKCERMVVFVIIVYCNMLGLLTDVCAHCATLLAKLTCMIVSLNDNLQVAEW